MVSLIIDFSNLAHASFYASLRGHTPETVPETFTDHIWGLSDRINKVVQATGGQAKLYFVYDNVPKHKVTIYPEYKAGRTRIAFPIVRSARAGLASWPVFHVEHPDYEADDVIASIITKVENPVIVSTDKDLWQLSNEAPIYDHYHMSYVDYEKIQDVYKARPEAIRLIKTLWGDSGDNVPNLVPRMQKQIYPLIDQGITTLDEVFAHFGSIKSERCKELLAQNKEALYRNQELVTLIRDIPVQICKRGLPAPSTYQVEKLFFLSRLVTG